MLEQLRSFRDVTRYPRAVNALIDGLECHTVDIYRGLSTGFKVSDGGTHLFGVSSPGDGGIEVFVSKKAATLVGTVLHVWLAANRIPRVERFNEEVRLEMLQSTDSTNGLPVSIRDEIQQATPSELLFLLQRLRLGKSSHYLIAAIQEYCEHILLEQTEELSWVDMHSRRYLGGELDMPQLIQTRLEKFARGGAMILPTLENLLHLHDIVEHTVVQSLYCGDRKPLDTLVDILLHAYDPWESWTSTDYVDIKADLFALIFFSALRKAALDDVYIEATDRCPYFLSQSDQAAVFAELWAVGSQCQGYFGILPRDMGHIVYCRYRDELKNAPPPVEMDGAGLMTCYANPEDILAAEKKVRQERERDMFVPYYGQYGGVVRRWEKAASELGSLTIFCFPAMVDVLLLSLVGRGLFVTAFMGDSLEIGCYALLISLLLGAGVTGWVGSTGSYYLNHVCSPYRPITSWRNTNFIFY
jgi:hypothetical protein